MKVQQEICIKYDPGFFLTLATAETFLSEETAVRNRL